MSILSTEKTHYLEIELYTSITPAGRTTRLCCFRIQLDIFMRSSLYTWAAVVYKVLAAYANYGSAALAIIFIESDLKQREQRAKCAHVRFWMINAGIIFFGQYPTLKEFHFEHSAQ